jgi:uncharacterized HhH-GPD family protein
MMFPDRGGETGPPRVASSGGHQAGSEVGMSLQLSQNPDADALLGRDPLALLVAMLLDQQVPLERAFSAPWDLAQRLGHDLDAREIAEYDPEAFAALFSQRPALHRFPGAMAKRVQELCRILVDRYDGDAASVWEGAASGEELRTRLTGLPGFGEQKARIFVALLGKQLEVRPEGWREVAGPYGEEGVYRSVADIVDEGSLREVRSYKQRMKAEAKAAGR